MPVANKPQRLIFPNQRDILMGRGVVFCHHALARHLLPLAAIKLRKPGAARRLAMDFGPLHTGCNRQAKGINLGAAKNNYFSGLMRASPLPGSV